jgi:serine/threonine protein phosphatase PrpC
MTSTEVVRKRKNRNKPHGNDDDEESNNNGSAVSTGGRLFIRKKKTSFMAKNHILSVTVIGIIIMSMVILAPKYLNVSTTAISKPQKIKQQHQQDQYQQYQQHQQQPLPQLPKLNMEQIMKNSNLPLLGIRPFTDISNSKYPQLTTKVSSLTPMVYYPYGDIQDILHPFDEEFRRKDFLMKEFEERKPKKQVTFYKEDEAVSNSNIDHYNKYFITTRRSYKGGPKENQVNQDRAIVIHPYPFLRQQKQQNQSFSMMIGIFDGHGEKGQLAAHFVQQYLPTLLATNLSKLQPQPQSQQAEDTNVNKNNDIVKQTLIDTFATVDEAMPSNIAFIAGCTTSIIIQTSNDTIYTANTGDSSTFLFMYIKSIKKVQILYISAKHKGDEILERQRIESMGGKVVLPAMKERTINGVLTEMTSRVVIPGGPGYGAVTLAMSRSSEFFMLDCYFCYSCF